MALIFRGSTCPLCGDVLNHPDVIEAFPAFIVNKRDPLVIFHDAAVHRSCLTKHPLGQEALRRREELRVRCGPGAHQCVVCDQVIQLPDEHFGTSYLGDESIPLGAFNYLQFHRLHFRQWARADELLARFDEAVRSGAWDGPTLVCDPLPRFVLSPTPWSRRDIP